MHKHTDPAGAAAELLKRRSIRNSLTEWASHKGFEPAPHHQLFIREIEVFLKSEDEVLLLFAPPGSAKSTYVSVLLPSWYLAANPTHSILAATHNVEFAERWGRRVRNDIAVDANVLGISLSEDSKAAARWSLTGGGEYYGVGAGVGISGFRANLGVGDDLFGSREDAYSDTVREKHELLGFPAGKHDDQVDALGLVGQLLDKMIPGLKPKEPEPKPDTGYRAVGLAELAADWVTF